MYLICKLKAADNPTSNHQHLCWAGSPHSQQLADYERHYSAAPTWRFPGLRHVLSKAVETRPVSGRTVLEPMEGGLPANASAKV